MKNFEEKECPNGELFNEAHISNLQEMINRVKKDKFFTRMPVTTNAGGRITEAIAEEVHHFLLHFSKIGKDFLLAIINHSYSGSRALDLPIEDVQAPLDRSLFCAVRPSVEDVVSGILADMMYLENYIRRKPGGENLLSYLKVFPVIRDNTVQETSNSKAYRTIKTGYGKTSLPVLTHSQKTNLYRFDLIVNCIDWRSSLWIADYKCNAPKHEEVAVAIGPYMSKMWNKEGCDHEIYLPTYAAQRLGVLTFAIPFASKSKDLNPITHLVDDVIKPKIDFFVDDTTTVKVPIYLLGNKDEQEQYLRILKPQIKQMRSRIELISVQFKMEFEIEGVDKRLII